VAVNFNYQKIASGARVEVTPQVTFVPTLNFFLVPHEKKYFDKAAACSLNHLN
jgi:hypothetical protein